jgi:hypothetical protein
MRHASLLAPFLLLSLAACRSEAPPEPAGPLTLEPAKPPARAWTSAFLKEAVLIADEIVIEGPFDLIEHVALRQDEKSTVYSTKTVPEGLLQELSAKPEAGVEVRAQLDGWALAAIRKITVLQRPGDVPVTVRASGDAFFAPGDGGPERREPALVFQGRHGS